MFLTHNKSFFDVRLLPGEQCAPAIMQFLAVLVHVATVLKQVLKTQQTQHTLTKSLWTCSLQAVP